MLDINIEKLDKVIDDFYKITGVMIGAYDADFKPISGKVYPHCSLCSQVRKYDHLASQCHQCDIEGIKKCTDSRATQIYKCHMGLTEAVTPIYADNVIIGYILIGQMLDVENADIVKNRIYALGPHIDKEALLQAMDNTPKLSADIIESIVSLMLICTKYLIVENVINIKSGILSKQIEQYIIDNLDKDIGIDSIVREMYISRTKLYELSSSFFNMGITEYIRFLRVEKAKEYLLGGKYNINQCAEMVGLHDANYFTKIFKKYTGMTPSEYKKSNLF